MLPFFGLLVKAKAVYEWLNFANDTVSVLGVVKRAAAATATVAVVAGAGVGAVKGVEAISQSPQERAIKQAIATHAPDITPDIRELVMNVSGENTYSKGFLYKKENHALLNAILAVCNDGKALPALQCDDAGIVMAALEREEYERERRARAIENQKKREADLAKKAAEIGPIFIIGK